MNNLLGLVLLMSAVLVYVQARSATSSDVRNINNKIRKLKSEMSRVKRYLVYSESYGKKIEQKRVYVAGDLVKRLGKCNSYLKSKQDWIVKHTNVHLGRFIKYNSDSSRNIANKVLKHSAAKPAWVKIREFNKFRRNVSLELKIVWRKRNDIKKMKKDVKILSEKVDEAKLQNIKGLNGIGNDVYLASRQVELQHFNEFEKARSDGNSGIKQIRISHVGGKNYCSNDHNGRSFGGMFDLSKTKQKVGMGEMVATLNGIEFRTSINNYELKKPAKDKTFHKTENIAFPDSTATILQMRNLFKAFKTQDYKTIDYRSYFKPVLTYMEGTWLTGDQGSDMLEKIKYTSYTGFEDKNHKLSYLPIRIMGFDKQNKPKYARWDYRILSHELNNDLPTRYLKIIFDPVSERRHDWNRKTYEDSATAKFDIEGLDVYGKRKERPIYYTYLDSLMEEIPGKDNYGASIMADGFDSQIKSANPKREGKSLNGAHYHRPYKLTSKDAMGVDTAQRSYCDRFYLALTTQTNVAGLNYVTKNKKNVHIKASYAIPVEITYRTPLNKWNPFGIRYEASCGSVTGAGTKANPYSAACPDRHYLTPDSFFTGGESKSCSNNNDIKYFKSPYTTLPVCLRPSGIHIVLPRINGIDGIIRQRYPIMPINGEGSSVWKKLNAIEDSLNLSV